MSRFLDEHDVAITSSVAEAPINPGSQDEEMESVGNRDHDSVHGEYDPDDHDFPFPTLAAVLATTATVGGPPVIQRVRISAISDFKDFTGRDQSQDQARAWISKVKSELKRDQASDAEKYLTFADLLGGPTRNWYLQLGRSTQSKWPDSLHSFQTQYCGIGVSVA
ncbi:hypothetical protein PI124_g18368 [Phytophthora idaei]|nr:hypothetical protein PI126_g15358 [Phytophthora idaei]KAG3236634.1 hypothetical protein PI124_g18368 [Phytophthora idaei]